MGQSASVVPFSQREGVRGEDKYAATTFRRIELQEDDLNSFYKVFKKIKDKLHPKLVEPKSICKYFGVSQSDFVFRLFNAVDFDGNDSIDFKEFTLGLWNFLSLSTDFLPALVFYIYDPFKVNMMEMKELKIMLESIHSVKLSPFWTPSLNHLLKAALQNNKNTGIDTEKFGLLCIDHPYTIKPIVQLQKKLRKKVLGAAYWKKLEFRRSASIKGNLRDVNYVYQVNEETEIWRKKDFELGIAKEYELEPAELEMKKAREKLKKEKEEMLQKDAEQKAQKEREQEEARIREEEERRQREEQEEEERLANLREEAKEFLEKGAGDKAAKSAPIMSQKEGRDLPLKTGVVKEFADFAESFFMTAEGKAVPSEVKLTVVTIFEFPGEEKFIFGLFMNDKGEERVVMVNRDLQRRRMKGSDLARINNNFKFVGYSKLSLRTLPDQIKIRGNEQLLQLCNDQSQHPDTKKRYVPGTMNKELQKILNKSTKKEESSADSQQNTADDEEERDNRVNSRVTMLLAKKRDEERKTIISRNTLNAGRRTINEPNRDFPSNQMKSRHSFANTEADGARSSLPRGAGRSTFNGKSGAAALPVGGKLAPIRSSIHSPPKEKGAAD